MPGPNREQEEADAAAAEAAAIGGRPASDPVPGEEDEAVRPLTEAGEGESEGFEVAEQELIEHASHGDQHAARQVNEDAPEMSDDSLASNPGEADAEHSSERSEDTP